ncbi:MAG TPA: glycosyltransferase family 4 protein [Bacillota bacterium]
MRVLILSWEFPPKVVGGIARHVADLSQALVKEGIEVYVITCGVQGAPETEVVAGVQVYRVAMNNPAAPDFLTWVLQLNLNLIEKANQLKQAGIRFDLVHSHDWLAAYAGKNLKHSWQVPLVSTIHATEYGRNNGLHNQLQRYISDVEWWLGYESWRVICCSQYMREELKRVFQIPDDKLRVIANGVYPEEFNRTNLDPARIRDRYCAADEKMLFYVGRVVREKGLGVLIEAMPRILEKDSKVKLVIAGKGPYLDELRHRAYQLGIYHRIYFTGFIPDNLRNALYQCADVAVFPSLYEPFGIVALEGMAAGAPVVVTDTGGMSEIIQHGRNGLKAYTDNPVSLADNILWALQHPDHTQQMRAQALADIKDIYNWDRIARQTIKVYREIIAEYQDTPWSVVSNEGLERELKMARMALAPEDDPGLERYQTTIKKEETDARSHYGRRKRHQTQALNL